MKQFLLSLAILVIQNFAFASGVTIGNGGVGINHEGKVYMLDLFEYGIQDSPTYGTTPLIPGIEEQLEEVFGQTNLTDVPIKLLTRKISDVMRMQYVSATALIDLTKSLEWRLVDSALIRLNDEGSVVNSEKFVQVAIRQKDVVFIDKNLWKQLDDTNKVALILHECIYYAQAPRDALEGVGRYQSAPDARKLTGLYFTKSFVERGAKDKNYPYSQVPHVKGELSEGGIQIGNADNGFWFALEVKALNGDFVFWNLDENIKEYCKSLPRKNDQVVFRLGNKYMKVYQGSYYTPSGWQLWANVQPGVSLLENLTFKVKLQNTTDCEAKMKSLVLSQKSILNKHFEIRN